MLRAGADPLAPCPDMYPSMVKWRLTQNLNSIQVIGPFCLTHTVQRGAAVRAMLLAALPAAPPAWAQSAAASVPATFSDLLTRSHTLPARR